MHNKKSIAATTIALVGASILTLATIAPGDAIAQTRRNNPQLNKLLRQGRELVEAGNYRQALQVYHQAVYIDQSNPKIYSGIGYLHTLDGDYSSAAQAYEYALVLEPRSLPFQYALAFCYAQLGRNRESELAYRQALRLNPNHVESHLGLGVVLMRQGQHRSAYAQYQAAARLDPQGGDVFGMMATALLEQDRTMEAIRLLQDSTQRYPRNGRLWLQLGIFLIGTTDDQVGALQALNQAARLDPNNPNIQIQLGSILKQQGNERDAQRLFYRAITSTPDTYTDQVRMGDLLYNEAVYGIAVLAYRRATELEPQNPKGFHRLGLALQGRAREIEAQSAWETAQDLYRRQGNENGADLMEALLDGEDSREPRFKPFN